MLHFTAPFRSHTPSLQIIDTSVFGNVAQTSSDAAYLARHVALRSGMRNDSIALTVNRLCGSGFQAIMSAGFEIENGEAKVALVGGAESMSQAPLSLYGTDLRAGKHALGSNLQLVDVLWAALTDSYCKTPMGITAENLAVKYGLTRAAVDEYALRSQHSWAAAQKAGVFGDEIAPVEVKGRKGPESVAMDEGPRPETTAEGLAKLAPVFKKDGVVTAGNASGITDGAASLILASEAALKEYSLTPLARIVGWSVAGVDPTIMGIGPAPAIRSLLAKTGKKMEDIDRWEVNEAFSAQVLAVEKELGIPREKLNTHGGAISLGHPLGASGARIMSHLTHVLRQKKEKLAIGSACIGGGQGIAIMIERC